MPAIAVDESRWPLVVVTYEGVATDAEFDAYLATMSGFLARKQATGNLLDARRAGATPATQRRRQAEWMKRHASELSEHSVGSAFVITSALVRGLLTGILWIQPMPNEHVVVATIDEADRWLRSRFLARGITIAPLRHRPDE